MIAVDTSSIMAYFHEDQGKDVDALDIALEQKQVVLPPVVLSEILSDPHLSTENANLFKGLPLLPIAEGYWERVGILRSRILSRGYKARLADALIAQSCIDHEVSLIARDKDFRHFRRWAGLAVVP